MTISPRPYQLAAIESTWEYLRANRGNPLVVLPTGSGKSCVVATLCRQAVEAWNGRVLVLTHVKELIEQLYATIRHVWPEAPCGINSAGVGRRDKDTQVLIASIQSVFRSGTDLGRFDLVLIDEAHLVPREGDGMYRTLLTTLRVINPDLRLIGLTATPFRLDSGWLHGDGALFEGVAYEAKVRDLIDQKWLSNLRGKDGGAPDLTNVHVRGGEYIPAELDAAVNTKACVDRACAEIVARGADRSGWLVFCCSVEHAFMVQDAIAKHVPCAIVVSDTPSAERAESIRAFKAKELRCLVSVGVLTTGFDAPHVDLIALLRPTLSPGLYMQMVGRGLRLASGKADCLVLDFANCIATHGPIDDIRINESGKREGEPGEAPVKTCPACQEILPASAIVCNGCGKEFPREMAKHDPKAANVSPLQTFEEAWVEVTRVDWMVHQKKDAPPTAPKSLRIVYNHGYQQKISDYICVEHSGYAKTRAIAWWTETVGTPLPATAADAVIALDNIARASNDRAPRLRFPIKLLLRFGGQWPEIVGQEYPPDRQADDEEPVYIPDTSTTDTDDLPF